MQPTIPFTLATTRRALGARYLAYSNWNNRLFIHPLLAPSSPPRVRLSSRRGRLIRSAESCSGSRSDPCNVIWIRFFYDDSDAGLCRYFWHARHVSQRLRQIDSTRVNESAAVASKLLPRVSKERRWPRLDFVSVSQEFLEDIGTCACDNPCSDTGHAPDLHVITVRKVKTLMIERYTVRNATWFLDAQRAEINVSRKKISLGIVKTLKVLRVKNRFRIRCLSFW